VDGAVVTLKNSVAQQRAFHNRLTFYTPRFPINTKNMRLTSVILLLVAAVAAAPAFDERTSSPATLAAM
jgi:hypothetical protein